MNVPVPIWKSKVVWTAFIALVGTIISLYANVPDALWVSIDAFLLVVIGKFAVDDAAARIVASIDTFVSELRAARLLALGKKKE